MSALRTVLSCAAAAAVAVSCGSGGEELSLPPGVSGLPAATIAAAVGLEPEDEAQLMTWADALGLQAGSTLAEPGLAYVAAQAMEVGWEDLASSPNFRAAFAARSSSGPRVGWAFLDLQLAVDHVLATSADGAVRTLVEPLGLGSLEWAIFSYPLPLRGARDVDGLIRVGDDPVSLARALGGVGGPSLIGRAAESGDAASLRIELRCDAEVVGRMLDAGTEPAALGAGLAARNALLGIAGQLGRTFVREVDGTASIAVFADETACAALRVREPDDVRDLLDRYFRPGDGGDVWEGPAGVRFEVVGNVLRVANRPWPSEGAVAGPDFGPGLHVEGSAVPGGFGAGFSAGLVRVVIEPADASTLRVSMRALD